MDDSREHDPSSDAAEFMETNRRNWDDRARLHARPTTGYRLDRYRDDPDRLSEIVTFDRHHLLDGRTDLRGVRALHLQCHIGTDTLSLARLGATVTGLDLSGASIEAARELFASVDTPGEFVESNVYDAVDALAGATFDLVYTGVGALNWLPDIDRWARVVAALTAPGGRLVMREGHPMAYAIDDTDRGDGVLRLKYPYFQTADPITVDEAQTYVDTAGERLRHTRSHEWNHGLGEVFTALTSAGLRVTTLEEHRGLDWWMIPGQVVIDGHWYLPDHQRDAAPMMYTIVAEAPA